MADTTQHTTLVVVAIFVGGISPGVLATRVDAAWGEGSYWLQPEWNRGKQHPSILDLRRLFWRHRARFSKLLRRLEEIEKVPQATASARKTEQLAA